MPESILLSLPVTLALEATHHTWIAYACFLALVAVFLVLDLGVFHRRPHEVSMKEAVGWSIVWVTLGLSFSLVVYWAYAGHVLDLGLDTPMYNPASERDPAADTIIRGTVSGAEAARQYVTAYVVEKSLAMDNLFVMAMIFGYFGVPAKYQHRVLFWGILGAILMRGAMIFAGSALVLRASWVLIIFGLFLLVTSIKMVIVKDEVEPGKNPLVRLVQKALPLVPFFDGQKFFTHRTIAPTYAPDPTTGELVRQPAPPGTLGRLSITPLFLALIVVEVMDLVFAVDSIPAVFAVTPDPFVVFTSNILAILGLRSLYFCLAAMIRRFRYLKPALVAILAFVGVKLLLVATPPYLDDLGSLVGLRIAPHASIKIDTSISMLVVFGSLGTAVLASIMRAREEAEEPRDDPGSRDA